VRFFDLASVWIVIAIVRVAECDMLTVLLSVWGQVRWAENNMSRFGIVVLPAPIDVGLCYCSMKCLIVGR
jgi:hypothetical protein